MLPPTPPAATASSSSKLEDAVLTLLGESSLEPDEVTEPGTPAPDASKLEPMEHVSKRTRAVPVFYFAKRRSSNELPWVEMLDGSLPSH
jgi:hypothetical protein